MADTLYDCVRRALANGGLSQASALSVEFPPDPDTGATLPVINIHSNNDERLNMVVDPRRPPIIKQIVTATAGNEGEEQVSLEAQFVEEDAVAIAASAPTLTGAEDEVVLEQISDEVAA